MKSLLCLATAVVEVFFVLFKNGKEIYIEISSEREYLDFIDCFRGLQN